jgi:hypothetical protein
MAKPQWGLAAAMIALVAMLGLTGLPATTATPAATAPCLADGSGFLTARLRGDLDVDLDWRGPALACTGMSRPDGLGMRLRFSGELPDGSALAIVFAPPRLAEGENGRAVPVNVTVLRESTGRIYGTRGEKRCTLDEVTQRLISGPVVDARLWEVQARGFCTEPARALDESGSVLLTRFDFRGQARLEAAPASQPKDAEE